MIYILFKKIRENTYNNSPLSLYLIKLIRHVLDLKKKKTYWSCVHSSRDPNQEPEYVHTPYHQLNIAHTWELPVISGTRLKWCNGHPNIHPAKPEQDPSQA